MRVEDRRLGHQHLVVVLQVRILGTDVDQSEGQQMADVSRDHRGQRDVGGAADQRGVLEHRPPWHGAPDPVVHVHQRRRRAVGERADDPRLVGHQLVEDVVEELEPGCCSCCGRGPGRAGPRILEPSVSGRGAVGRGAATARWRRRRCVVGSVAQPTPSAVPGSGWRCEARTAQRRMRVRRSQMDPGRFPRMNRSGSASRPSAQWRKP